MNQYTNDFEPCPFCGWNIQIAKQPDHEIYWAYCSLCGARSKYFSEKKDAAKAWNKRVRAREHE